MTPSPEYMMTLDISANRGYVQFSILTAMLCKKKHLVRVRKEHLWLNHPNMMIRSLPALPHAESGEVSRSTDHFWSFTAKPVLQHSPKQLRQMGTENTENKT